MRALIGYLVCLIVAATIAFTFSAHKPVSEETAQLRPDRLQINGMLYLDHRVVAVGERGNILLSDDQGGTWQSATVKPQRDLTLTALVALDDKSLLAVGHDGWILRSVDEGANWEEVRYDADVAEPLLGIWNAGGKQVLAFGSFGKFYQSNDDGRTWQASALEVDSAHLNGMDGGADGRRMLVGEQGLVMRSDDAGRTWHKLPAFYNGSLFGVVRLSPDRWVTYGMRGHVFVSQNFGQTWDPVDVGNQLPLYGHVLLPNGGGLLIVGAGSSMVRLDGNGHLVNATRLSGLGTLTSAVLVGARRLLVGGERGVFQGTDGSVAALGQ
ncbi:WD40/YVTN/BNR-like repeat-containing protein [Pseudomonas sp. NPDC096917]|uniref:WD40/YVTN/BNR-like repeat-containing protein n=1 Tax=Pseudomonas sp. NPDC096917 TaxID=3364483 RepID=UPI003839CFC4